MIRKTAGKCRTFLRLLFYRLIYLYGGIAAVQNRIPSLSNPASVLRLFGAHIGERSIIYPGLVIHAGIKDFSNLTIGKECRVLRGAFLDLTDSITLEDKTSLGIRSTLITHVNAAQSPLGASCILPEQGPIVLRRGAVTYTGAIILMGVTLEECSVVGAGSVVSRDVPPNTVVMGNPARRVRSLDPAAVRGSE